MSRGRSTCADVNGTGGRLAVVPMMRSTETEVYGSPRRAVSALSRRAPFRRARSHMTAPTGRLPSWPAVGRTSPVAPRPRGLPPSAKGWHREASEQLIKQQAICCTVPPQRRAGPRRPASGGHAYGGCTDPVASTKGWPRRASEAGVRWGAVSPTRKHPAGQRLGSPALRQCSSTTDLDAVEHPPSRSGPSPDAAQRPRRRRTATRPPP